jgi:hypothetical protein
MMRSSFVVLAVVGILFAFSTAWADDYNPPPWERGAEGTTHAIWEFEDNGANPSAPTSSSGTAGAPSISVSGSFPQTFWWDVYPQDTPHLGVWQFEDDMTLTVPNYDIDNPIKDIWLQLTYLADMRPNVWMWPEGDSPTGMTLVDETPLHHGYVNATWYGRLEPNPLTEYILIGPSECTTYIDQVVIDTICTVPEPGTILLLGLGGLALLRRRRG